MKTLKKYIPDKIKCYIKRYLTTRIRKKYKHKGRRKDPCISQVGIDEEILFWRYSLTSGLHDYRLVEKPFGQNLIDLIESGLGCSPNKAVVVDVGSGPLTTLGTQWKDKELQVYATDTLGNEYRSMLEEFSLTPPVMPIFAEAEHLDCLFEIDSVDLVCCSNALDHCRDPLAAIDSMLSILKPGCFIFIWSFENEGAQERYQGMHQWDLYEHKGDFYIAGPENDVSIKNLLEKKAEVSCKWYPDGPGNRGHIEVLIRKNRKIS